MFIDREREKGTHRKNGFVLKSIWNWICPIAKQRKMSR